MAKRPWTPVSEDVKGVSTMEEALEQAGAMFEVRKVNIAAKLNGGYKEIPEKFATVRIGEDEEGDETSTVLGVVGKRYQIIQNKDAFAFFNYVLDEGRAQIERVGVLDGGRRVWALAKMPKRIVIMEEDRIQKYLLIMTSHDGSTGVRVAFTPVRVVCHNALAVAMRSATASINVRHTKSHRARLEEAVKVVKMATHYWRRAKNQFRELAATELADSDVGDFLENLFPSSDGENRRTTKTDNIRQTIMDLYRDGRGSEIAYGTAWGAFNAVTEWLDHHRIVRATSDRWSASVFGSGIPVRQKAFRLLTEA